MGDLQDAHGALVEFFADHDEPMPAWGEGNKAALETLTQCVDVSAFGQEKYPTVEEKAAKLFYSCVKMHAFPNGNKRFGVAATMFFLILNDRRLNPSQGELAGTAKRIAERAIRSKPALVLMRWLKNSRRGSEPRRSSPRSVA